MGVFIFPKLFSGSLSHPGYLDEKYTGPIFCFNGYDQYTVSMDTVNILFLGRQSIFSFNERCQFTVSIETGQYTVSGKTNQYTGSADTDYLLFLVRPVSVLFR